MLFEVAIIEKPSKKEEEEGAVEKLVFGPKAVIARDPSGAVIAAVLNGSDKPTIDLNKAEVLVRPFVSSPK
jgi:hypothetical protein